MLGFVDAMARLDTGLTAFSAELIAGSTITAVTDALGVPRGGVLIWDEAPEPTFLLLWLEPKFHRMKIVSDACSIEIAARTAFCRPSPFWSVVRGVDTFSVRVLRSLNFDPVTAPEWAPEHLRDPEINHWWRLEMVAVAAVIARALSLPGQSPTRVREDVRVNVNFDHFIFRADQKGLRDELDHFRRSLGG